VRPGARAVPAGPGAARGRAGVLPPGGAVQVEPIKPTLKAPGIKLSKPKYGKPLSFFGFKFNLRRYNRVLAVTQKGVDEVGRCSSAASNPAFKARLVSALETRM